MTARRHTESFAFGQGEHAHTAVVAPRHCRLGQEVGHKRVGCVGGNGRSRGDRGGDLSNGDSRNSNLSNSDLSNGDSCNSVSSNGSKTRFLGLEPHLPANRTVLFRVPKFKLRWLEGVPLLFHDSGYSRELPP